MNAVKTAKQMEHAQSVLARASSSDIAWVAGLLEAEGSFRPRSDNSRPIIQLNMTDRDVVERAYSILGHVGSIHVHVPQTARLKTKYMFGLNYSLSEVWMSALYPFMGIRRRAQILKTCTVSGTNRPDSDPVSLDPLSLDGMQYLSGLLEGDGSFKFSGGSNIKRTTPGIALGMIDRDVVERAASMLGHTGKISTFATRTSSCMHIFNLNLGLSVQWMMTLYPLMGTRRREQIRQLLGVWRVTALPERERVHCPLGHPYSYSATRSSGHRSGSRRRGRRYCRECELGHSKMQKGRYGRRSDGRSMEMFLNG